MIKVDVITRNLTSLEIVVMVVKQAYILKGSYNLCIRKCCLDVLHQKDPLARWARPTKKSEDLNFDNFECLLITYKLLPTQGKCYNRQYQKIALFTQTHNICF